MPEPTTPPERTGAEEVDITFVVIGLNEATVLPEGLRSTLEAPLDGHVREVIYVDGGSTDGSVELARRAGIDRVIPAEGRRRAAENRNLGLRAARGRFVQFLDGDMVVAPDWPAAALDFMAAHPDVAAVCGNIHEANEHPMFKAIQIDWAPREGPIRHCGGAALWRREVLEARGGFPEDIAYGEEPVLCWRIRNETDYGFYQLNRRMVDHDLGFTGLGDYWRRNVRCGATYAEVAARCRKSADRLWLRESVVTVAWAIALVAAVALVMALALWRPAAGTVAAIAVVFAGALLVLRQALKGRRVGAGPGVAVLYGIHTYFSKLPIAWGIVKWVASQGSVGGRGA